MVSILDYYNLWKNLVDCVDDISSHEITSFDDGGYLFYFVLILIQRNHFVHPGKR